VFKKTITRRHFVSQISLLPFAIKPLRSREHDLDFEIGQMIMTNFPGTQVTRGSEIIKMIQGEHLGGVLLFEFNFGSAEHPKSSLQKLTADLQGFSSTPLLIAIDQEGGSVNRLKEKYGYPPTVSARELGQVNDLSYTFQRAEKIASALVDAGINMNLAPVVDLYINPNNPVVGTRGRCFSANPEMVVQHAAEFIRAHREQNVLTTLKHFPGHGSSEGDSHNGVADVSDTWSDVELVPYQELINSGLVDAIMSAHIYNRKLDKELPASLSHNIITGLLRHTMGFGGIVISDDLLMGAVEQLYSLKEAVALSLKAGADILLFSSLENHLVLRVKTIMKQLVEQGEIPAERIRESAFRIAQLKRRIVR